MATLILTAAQMKLSDITDMLSKQYENIAINIFEWKGLEDISPTLTSEIIEKTLYEKGCCLFFKDSNLGYMALPATLGKPNVYNKPVDFQAIGFGYSEHYTDKNSVLICNNELRTIPKNDIDYYCGQLAQIIITKDLRLNAHKTPYAFEISPDTLLSAQNYYNKLNVGEPTIFINKTAGKDGSLSAQVLNTGVEYINDRLDDEYNTVVARILTYLGIDNFVEDKAERVQSAEVESNQEYIISNFRVGLEQRKKACEKINKMFGLNLSVDYVREDQIETSDNINQTGGNEDE